MKALSLRQPWAAAVLHLGKRIENRRWPTSFRGEFLIHASKGMTRDEHECAVEFCEDVICAIEDTIECPRVHEILARDKLLFGGIVGIATLVGVVPPRPPSLVGAPHPEEVLGALGRLRQWYPARAQDVWRWHAHEQWGFILEDIRPTPFVPCKGALGFFDVPEDVVQKALARAAVE